MGSYKHEVERFDRLKAVLRQSVDGSPGWQLSQMMEQCGIGWHGRYECRSPACPSCRRKAIRKQQREMRTLFAHIPNRELAYVSIVVGGTTDINEVAVLLKKGQQDLRNRLRSCRRSSSKWDHCAIRGWHEVDAVFPEQVPLLATQRLDLISALAPISFDQVGPTWFATIHAIAYLGDVDVAEFSAAMRQQWPLTNQVDVRLFHAHQQVGENLNRLVSYSLKFACSTNVPASTWGGKMIETWPAVAEAQLCLLLHHGRRNAFEQMRFFIGQKSRRPIASCATANEAPSAHVFDQPMPIAVDSNINFTRYPTYKYYYQQEVVYDQFSSRHPAISDHFRYIGPP